MSWRTRGWKFSGNCVRFIEKYAIRITAFPLLNEDLFLATTSKGRPENVFMLSLSANKPQKMIKNIEMILEKQPLHPA